MEIAFREQLKERHDFASWKGITTLGGDLHITRFSFSGREFPEWRLLRSVQSESTAGQLHQSMWKRAEDELLSVNVLECASLVAAHEAIIDFLGEFESPVIARQTGNMPGDVAFAMPGETAVLFARANLVVLMRNAGPKTMALGTLARHFDNAIIRREDSSEPALTWRATNAPMADQLRGKRYDDVWFVTPDLGWGVNSDGKILRTTDGGASWDQQFHDRRTYFRCLGFASETRGWAGALSGPARLLETRDGATWSAVTNLPEDAPEMICGLTVVNESVVYASGTNYPFPFSDNPPPAMMKTVDGGATWTALDMTSHASLLVDIYFTTPQSGWVVGGKADPAIPAGPEGRDNIKPVVLFTEDGGQTWVDRVADLQDVFPFGEWGWKIQFLDEHIGFISLENFNDGAILKTTDGGNRWTRLEIDDPQQNANLEGVGFVDETLGWVGGWGTPAFVGGQSSATSDGGESWSDANEIGKFINRFRFLDSPVTVGYAAGATVYKYSHQPVPAPARMAVSPESAAIRLLESEAETDSGRRVRIPVIVPDNASRIVVNVWERFGRHVGELLDESNPAAGARTVEWDATGHSGSFIVRVTVDDNSESQIVWVGPR